jgi:hypothetical protein
MSFYIFPPALLLSLNFSIYIHSKFTAAFCFTNPDDISFINPDKRGFTLLCFVHKENICIDSKIILLRFRGVIIDGVRIGERLYLPPIHTPLNYK